MNQRFALTLLQLLLLILSIQCTASSSHSNVPAEDDSSSSAVHFVDSSHTIIQWRGQQWTKIPLPQPQPQQDSAIEAIQFSSSLWFIYLFSSLTCVLFAALAAGLTIGLLSIDPLSLRIILNTEESDFPLLSDRENLFEEQKYARKLLPIVEQHHLLLVTLLLINSIANECLPLFLDRLVPSYIAILLSVTFLLLFSEILPSAIFSGPNQLKFAAKLSPIVYILMGGFYIIAAPIAAILDRTLGVSEIEYFGRGELKALIKLHAAAPNGFQHVGNGSPNLHPTTSASATAASMQQQVSIGAGSDSIDGLSSEEISIIHGALELSTVKAGDVIVPWKRVKTLDFDTILDENSLADLMASSHSRIPVVDRKQRRVVGILLVKRLAALNPDHKRKVESLMLRKPLVIGPNTSLLHVLRLFQLGKSHLAIVSNEIHNTKPPISTQLLPQLNSVIGIVTIEDLIGQLFHSAMRDEGHDGISIREALKRKIENRKLEISKIKTGILNWAQRSRKRVANRKLAAERVLTKANSIERTLSANSNSSMFSPKSGKSNYGATSNENHHNHHHSQSTAAALSTDRSSSAGSGSESISLLSPRQMNGDLLSYV